MPVTSLVDDRAREAERSALASRLRWALSRRGITMAAAERAAGLADGTLGHVTSGRRPGARVGVVRVRPLAAALRVSAAWLLLGEGPACWIVRLWHSGRLGVSSYIGKYLGPAGEVAARGEAGSWGSRREARDAIERAGLARQRGDQGSLGWDAGMVVVGVVPRLPKEG